MKIIKEPDGIDLVVDGRALKAKDLEKIDEAIKVYKAMKNRKKIAVNKTEQKPFSASDT